MIVTTACARDREPRVEATWHRGDAIAAFIHDTASKPVDRLVAVEGDDRSTFIAVDPATEVHVVA